MGMNNKGFAEGLLMIVVVGIIAALFFAGWMYGSDLLRTQLSNFESDTSIGNISEASDATYAYVDEGYQNGLPLIALTLLVGFAIATMIMAYFSVEHPSLIFIFIMIVVGTLILSVYVSNAYENLLSNNVLGSTLNGFTAFNFIMSHLSMWVTVIGLFGIVLMIAGRYII